MEFKEVIQEESEKKTDQTERKFKKVGKKHSVNCKEEKKSQNQER